MQKLKTVDADTLLTTPMEKTAFIVDGLIPQGVTLLCGASKVGKSWLMLYLGLQVAQGLPMEQQYYFAQRLPCLIQFIKC